MKIIPTSNQLEFLNWEFGVFFHFGIRSFFLGHSDWDNREMSASAFNPENLDCAQWIKTAHDAGAKYAILVAKHHDGFANWNSAYTDYSVAASPWKDGEGDVVREYVDACREYGLKVGIYYSPAQWGTPTHNGKVISFEKGSDYDDYFINQIGELLTNYGKIDYLWFDGCGSEGHEYDKTRIIKAIRSMQPEILIFGMWDPNTQWVGNEDGYAPSPNFNTVSDIDFSMLTTEKKLLEHAKFLPSECDCKMRSTWFDCEENEDTVKEIDELVGMYEYSVGRGANFLINIGPSGDGRLPEKDTRRLLEFGDEIRRRYGKSIAGFSDVSVNKDGEYEISREGAMLCDRAIIEENLTEGEAVCEFKLYAHLPAYTSKRILIYSGNTIGHKAICAFPTIKTAKLVLEITKSDGNAIIKDMKAYYTGKRAF